MKGKKCRIAFIEVESENFDSIKEICWSGFRLTRVAKLCKCLIRFIIRAKKLIIYFSKVKDYSDDFESICRSSFEAFETR